MPPTRPSSTETASGHHLNADARTSDEREDLKRTASAADTAEEEEALDAALEESFPASDPLAVAPKRGGKTDKRIAHTAPSDRSEPDTTDAKTPSNMRKFHTTFERRRR